MFFKKKASDGKMACRYIDEIKVSLKKEDTESQIHFLAKMKPELEQLSSLLKATADKKLKGAFIKQNKPIVEGIINDLNIEQAKLCLEYLKKKGRL